jgi:hypothetical protein
LCQTPPKPAEHEIPEISTDRPDFTESVETVAPGLIQFEDGFTTESEAGTRRFSTPELLLRVGLTRRLELRFGDEGLLSERTTGSSVHGRSDSEVAVKVRLWEQGRFRPAVSLIPILSLPTGHTYFSSHGYDPTLKIALAKDLRKGFSISGNLNFSRLSDPEGRYAQRALSCSLGHALAAGFSGYWEVFTFSPWDKGASAAWVLNTGVSHHIGRNVQVDVRVGKRVTDVGPNYFFGAGVAFRRSLFAHY